MDEDPVFTFDEDVDERTSLPTYDALVESGRIVVASNRQVASDSGNSMMPPRRRDDDVKVLALYERICEKLAPLSGRKPPSSRPYTALDCESCKTL